MSVGIPAWVGCGVPFILFSILQQTVSLAPWNESFLDLNLTENEDFEVSVSNPRPLIIRQSVRATDSDMSARSQFVF